MVRKHWHLVTPSIERYVKITLHLAQCGAVTTDYLRTELGASRATAKRDMVRIEGLLPVASQLEQTPHGKRRVIRLLPTALNQVAR